MKSTYLEAKSIINGKPFDEIVNLPKIDKRFSYGALNGSEGEGLVDLNFKDILVTVRNNNGVATIVNYEQYDTNGQFTDLVHTNESKTNKNMKKNTVKLNESQLKKIIAESVKNVLSELDWKTYANARDKARERGEHKRAMKFGNAADNAFNDEFAYADKYGDKYGEGNVHGDTFMNTVNANSKPNGFKSPSHSIRHLSGDLSNEKPYNYDDTKAFGLMDKYDEEGRYKRVKNPSLKKFFNDSEQEKAFRRASKEMDDYVSGNYTYDNENGWHLKESIEKAVKNVLKEYLNKNK